MLKPELVGFNFFKSDSLYFFSGSLFILTRLFKEIFMQNLAFDESKSKKNVFRVKFLEIRTILDIIRTFCTIRTILWRKKNPYNPYILATLCLLFIYL